MKRAALYHFRELDDIFLVRDIKPIVPAQKSFESAVRRNRQFLAAWAAERELALSKQDEWYVHIILVCCSTPCVRAAPTYCSSLSHERGDFRPTTNYRYFTKILAGHADFGTDDIFVWSPIYMITNLIL